MTYLGLILLIATIYWGWRLFKKYRGWQWFKHSWPALILLFVSFGLMGSNTTTTTSSDSSPQVKKVHKTRWLTTANDSSLKKLQADNRSASSSLKSEQSSVAKLQSTVEKQKAKNKADGATKTTAATTVKATKNPSNTTLADKNYDGQQTITINNNNPGFSKADLSTSNGAWQKYGDLDHLNRVTAANALLNKSLMPSAERGSISDVKPTGWHQKKVGGTWLYNRSHLIGYQLTGQNSNWKNLMTGTRSLNAPEMVTYENQVADYLRADKSHYVRYEVKPIFKGNELLARGVQMRGQSVGNNTVSFNIYIFNVQPGVTINYGDGTSRVSN
ncbi:DNA/RNA non-specific endonuclease [Lactiplantibacillus fabifermentans]|uniref:Prophage Lp1 protein 65 n=2 Tax=Lactiplantibacillus fabifermentans TaxID=483011 RepID=A0A0R2NJX0_9LACO|nr:DNA/RNA non-specific endonuclease [Lactiplantibacillus fabifermentans]ETY75223.1 DNA entry nuclease [Lactiplantibacillus fabifermentans T30PCM01]KRO24035.1 prophage Lp1 protein 65 [Lactiplantibacillus fabifermentans DSM 21115]